MIAKICTKCGLEKLLEEFHKDLRYKNRRIARCKSCIKRQYLEYSRANPEKAMLRQRKFRKKNKERVGQYDVNIITQTCVKCGVEKLLKKFYTGGGGSYGCNSICIECDNKKSRLWHQDNLEYARLRNSEYQKNNLKKHSEATNRYNKKNRKTINKLRRERRKSDFQYCISLRMSAGVNHALKGNKNGRHWETLVDYTLLMLITHLKTLFYDNPITGEKMTWNNYGKWHIDHIIPKCRFSYDSYDDIGFKTCWELTNLQPLWAEDNLRKSSKLNWKRKRI